MTASRGDSDGFAAQFEVFAAFLRNCAPTHTRAIFLFSIVTNIMLLAPSFHMLQVYDRVLTSGSAATLIYITAIAIFALCVYGVAETIRSRIAQRLSATFAVHYSQKMFARFAQLPPDGAAAGTYLREYAMIKTFLSSKVFVNLFDLPFIPLFLLLLYFVHPTVFLLTVIGVIAMIAISYLNITRSEASRSDSRSAEAQAIGFAQNAFARADYVRALGLLPAFINIWGQKSAEALDAAEQAASSSAFYYALGRAVRQMIQVATMAWGGWLVLAGDMSGGLIFLASMISGKALGPIEQVIGGWENMSKSLAALSSIEALTGADKRLQARPELPAPKGYLQAREIVFGSDRQVPVLAGVSLDLRPGEVTILHGASGSGKSTLLRILAGAAEPEGGTVLLDGAPRSRWPVAQWGSAIGYCGEDPALLPGTVAANICRFAAEPDPEEVYRVAKLVNIHEMILSLPQGYQTVISDGNANLSSSQAQQIAIARALYGRPCALLFDQPTAHLDQRGEGAFVNALAAARKEGAAIMMATRSGLMFRIATHALTMRAGMAVPTRLPESLQPARRASQSAVPGDEHPDADADETGLRGAAPAEAGAPA